MIFFLSAGIAAPSQYWQGRSWDEAVGFDGEGDRQHAGKKPAIDPIPASEGPGNEQMTAAPQQVWATGVRSFDPLGADPYRGHQVITRAASPNNREGRMQVHGVIPCAPVTTFDTRVVSPTDRIRIVEQCGEYVVGLTCLSMEVDGLKARFRYVDLGAIKLVDITGHQHVVERLPVHLRTREKDSVFLTLLVRGAAFVNRANECVVLNEGDVVLYDTNRPYMHGFPGFMRHIMFEVPGNEFRQRFPGWDLRAARRYDASVGAGRQISASLRQIITHHSPF